MTVKINADTSDGLKFVSDTSGEIDLQANGSTKVHMASDGKVGIGTTSPDAALTVQRAGESDITFKYTDGNTKAFSKFDNSDFTFKQGTVGNDAYAFFTANTERMRIDSSGRVLINCSNFSNEKLQIDSGTSTALRLDGDGTGLHSHVNISNANGIVGTIKTTGSSTQYNTSSDYRLKENVSYTFDATTRLKQLKPARFNFKADADTTVDGFIAHEVSSIVPEAISGDKDATKDVGTIKDADGNVIHENVLEVTKEDGQTWEKTSTENVYQGIDQSKLVPLLVKTIQELEARITALES